MAKKKDSKKPKLERPEVASDNRGTPNDARLREIRENYERGSSAEAENKRLLSEDLNFVFNAEDQHAQWDALVLNARRSRPSYTYNRCLHAVNMVIGDFMQVEPQIKIRAANKQASVATATVWEGIVRGIEFESRARQAVYNPAFKQAVGGGYAIWRVQPDYFNDESMDQTLKILLVPNPQTGFWNPEVQCPYLSDMTWGGFAETIGTDIYEVLYPGFDPVPFTMSRDNKGWVSTKQIRIAEYFKKIKTARTIAELDNGRVIDFDKLEEALEHAQATAKKFGTKAPQVRTDAAGRARKRQVPKWQVEWVKVDGFNILEGPITYDWTSIPIVRLPGRYVTIEGRKKCQSLIRHTKDAQRTYNLHRSTMIESVALTPRAPYMVTPKMIKAYEDMWATANTTNRPYLLYDPDKDAAEAGGSGKPTREPPPDVPTGLIQLAGQDLQDLQAGTGYFDASLGSHANDSDRTSGDALVARQRRGDLGSYEFINNFAGALEVTYKHIVDMGKSTLDTDRLVRTVGADAISQFIRVNGGDPGDVVHKLTEGAYDVTATVGPGYQTARQDTLQTLLEASSRVEVIGQIGADIIARNIDVADADELARRIRIGLIKQGIVQPTPEEQAQLPPDQPNPQQQAELARAQALAQKDQANAAKAVAELHMGPIEMHKAVVEAAGKHLANILAAQQIQSQAAEAKADEEEAKAAGGAPQGPMTPPAGPGSQT